MKSQRAAKVEKKDFVEVTLENGAVLKGKTVILSTGARYRQLGVPLTLLVMLGILVIVKMRNHD